MKYWPLYSCSVKPELLVFHIMCKLFSVQYSCSKMYLIQTASCVLSAICVFPCCEAMTLYSLISSLWYRMINCVICHMQCWLCCLHCLQCALSPVVTLWMDHFGWQRLSHLPRPSLPYFNHAPVTLVSIPCSCHTLAYVTFVFPAHANNSHRAIILPDLDTSND